MGGDGLVLMICLLVVVSMQALVVLGSRRPPAMYVFGDSTLDVGNNNYLPGKDVARANRSPYGLDFPGVPTGRFSNGYNTADYVGAYVRSISYLYIFFLYMHFDDHKNSRSICACMLQQRAWASSVALRLICRWQRAPAAFSSSPLSPPASATLPETLASSTPL
jgi:hypothetical protein